ncbi:hypothetical protein WA026_009399 [Henosepilachna vigintioctopunctata]|uniref:Small ribosomal subunit protein uS10m n=1 Tax=Henosepilachna vigintioctopunctata TaxID=420089 RepID=A0AAW1U6Q3_9CUCU
MLGFIRNSVSRNLLRSSLSTTVEPVKTLEPAPVELDKLYKTMQIELRGNDPAVLNSYVKFATTAGNHLDVNSKSWKLRKPNHERLTVLKAIHVQKKHRVQYEFRTYYSFISYMHLTESTALTLLEYIQRNLPEGVSMKATSIELQKLPVHLTREESEQSSES